ncbi:MAG: DUF4139 domain-containing protein [Bacteroidales bacterium]|nr:DUF4139 domain-containing protein [Bacteroidales bacterium]
MKILMSLFLTMAVLCAVADEEKPLTTKINNVTVFLSGAQIERTGSMYLTSGNYDIVIEDLPTTINSNTIQVTGKGNLTVLSVENRINYLKSQKKTKEVITLEDSLKLMQKQIAYQQALLQVYREEEAMILANKLIGGADNGVDIAALKANADFYRIRLTDLKTKQLDISYKVADMQLTVNRLNQQLSELNAKRNQPTGEIVVRVHVTSAGQASFNVKYNVANAGWTAMYDIRAIDVNNPVSLNFKAGVYQNTGENWDNVKLTLSTANPNQSNAKPILSPWYLYYNNYYNTVNAGSRNKASAVAPTVAMDNEEVLAYETEKDFGSAVEYTTVVEYPINFEYTIDLPYDVNSNGKVRIVEVQKYELDATYEYFAVPKVDPDAFLLARVTGWEKFNLLPGESNIFFMGTYVGKSYINPLSAMDTLDVSLGRDKAISLKREMIKDFTSDQFIGTNRRITKGWEMTIKNNKSKEIEIVIEDQFPISSNKEIVIEHVEDSEGIVNETIGKVSWRFKLKPYESKKIVIKYSVKFPKEQTVIVY